MARLTVQAEPEDTKIHNENFHKKSGMQAAPEPKECFILTC